MSETSLPLFHEDAYLETTTAKVLSVNEDGSFVTDRSIFYAASGGQPGDTGSVTDAAGQKFPLLETRYADDRQTVLHFPDGGTVSVGDEVNLTLNWERRHKLMRMHSALHLLCSLIPFPVTGGSIGEAEGRLDFDMPENPDKPELTGKLMALVNADHPITTHWITDEELEAKPDMVRTMSVKPPMGTGKVRLVSIGENGSVDLQPCGGTHVKSTGEIGEIHIGKVEKKGKMNRRIRVRFGPLPS